ncbi:V0D/AC39 family V-type ATPase subunit [Thiocapsa bogorovii]|uniref:V0D/AC39 family V-type ATPase subunit n=1 Tax=Thiocapsa bogorovii TaxID=521689 RepID=UPI001E450C1F|nr:V-type ATPase subunit [Thiocapsa bogorovii]UHD16919.1 V-type ATPase subunit [Thiocapsa bogorovii]
MTIIADHAYLNTRVSVMATQLLEPTEIAALAHLPLPTLAERFGLTAILDAQQSTRARSRAVEQSLIQVLLSELLILVRPMNTAERALVLDWGRKYALFNLKTLIRGKLYDLDQKEIHDNLYELPEYMRLSEDMHTDLFRAENVLELLRQLEAGAHRTLARQAREVYEQQREPFALEAAIDQRYYAALQRHVMAFGDPDLAPLKRLVGAELDRINLLWLLRFRFSYQLSASETFYHLVPSMRLLTRDRLLNLANIETFEGILATLPAPLDRLLAGSKNIVEIQKRIGAYAAHEAHWVLHRTRSGVARALAYLMLRERDLLLLFALAQGQILNLPSAAIEIAVELAEPGCPWAGGRAA